MPSIDFSARLASEAFLTSPNKKVFRLVLSVVAVIIILFVPGRFGLAGGYPVSLLNPGTKIDELTTLRAKRTVRVVFPRYLNPTDGAFDTRRHDRGPQGPSVLEAKSSSRSTFLDRENAAIKKTDSCSCLLHFGERFHSWR